MNNAQIKKLCLNLMKADTEKEVINLLKEAGFWDDKKSWRYYGDDEGCYSTIGNQQSRADAALVEKLVNAIDARLMNEALVRGIDPKGSYAPKDVHEAVGKFFDPEVKKNFRGAGRIRNWPNKKRTEVAMGITLASTGAMPREGGKPCISIADAGEGQVPRSMPETFLSLHRSNKQHIPFVQGKFNMGGTGALNFCGIHGLQLILTRRNPAILTGKGKHETDDHWGFTVVRKTVPEPGSKMPAYCYLAPVGASQSPGRGDVLSFSSATMPIFPEERDPYSREAEWGSLVKLYEYSGPGYSNTHIFLKSGLMRRLDLLLPDAALPIRLYECRGGAKSEKGAASFATTLNGLTVRLSDDLYSNLEEGLESSASISASGEEMTVTIHAFKKGKSGTYKNNEGVIFTVDGQTHGHLTKGIFARAGLSYLQDSLLVVVDCSKLGVMARANLFMNSRDRLKNSELKAEIQEELELLLKSHQGLRDLLGRRRREQIESKLDDDKPLVDVLETILKGSPTLAELFLSGKRLSKPVKPIDVDPEEEPFEGKRYPTYFHAKGKKSGSVVERDCHINLRCRIAFETDAVNDYLSRSEDPGNRALYLVKNGESAPVGTSQMNLNNGVATLNIKLPPNCRVGDELRFRSVVTDSTRIDPFETDIVINVREKSRNAKKTTTSRRRPSSQNKGKGREALSQIQLPVITEVYEDPKEGQIGWASMEPPFDGYTALRIKQVETGATEDGDEPHEVYDFQVNMDNIHLQREIKSSKAEPDILRTQFKVGMVLIGLALIQREKELRKASKDANDDDENDSFTLMEKVEEFSRAAAQILLPMLESLGGIEADSELVLTSADPAD